MLLRKTVSETLALMTYFDVWSDELARAFVGLWVRFINFLPEFLGALVVLIIGLILADWLARLARTVVETIRLDQLLQKTGAIEQIKALGIELNFAKSISWAVRWFVIIAVWVAVLNVLHLEKVGDILAGLLAYLPNVITAVIILAVGLLGGNWLGQVISRAVTASQLPNSAAGTLASLARWAVITFAFLAVLSQLGVATRLIEILFAGLVLMLAIAGGLAFGLGGKDKAAQWLDSLNKELSGKK